MAAQLFDPSTMQAGNNLAKAIDNVVKNRFAQEELDQKVRLEEQKYDQQGAQDARMFKLADRNRVESREDSKRIFDEQVRQSNATHDNRLLEGQTQLAQNELVLKNQEKAYNAILEQTKAAKIEGNFAKQRDLAIKAQELGLIIQKGKEMTDKIALETTLRTNILNTQIKANQNLVKYIGDPAETGFTRQKLQEGFTALKLPNNEIVATLQPKETRNRATKVLNMMLNVINGVESQSALVGYKNWTLEHNMQEVLTYAQEAGINAGEENTKLAALMERVTRAFEDKGKNLAIAIEGTQKLVNAEGFMEGMEAIVKKESNATGYQAPAPQQSGHVGNR